MATNTEDTVFSGMGRESAEAVASAAKTRRSPRELTKVQKVVVGGIAALALTSGSLAMAMPLFKGNEGEDPHDGEPADDAAAQPVADTGLKVAEVSDDQSFAEAFSSARESVGSGGMFQWHGNVYSTHTAEEWDGMSQAERQEFTDQVDEAVAEVETLTEDPSVLSGGVSEGTVEAYDASDAESIDGSVHNVDDTADVRILGTTEVEMEDGSVVTIGEGIVEDHEVYLVDVDGDQIYDIAVDDDNENGIVTDTENYDVSDDNLTADIGYTGTDELVL